MKTIKITEAERDALWSLLKGYAGNQNFITWKKRVFRQDQIEFLMEKLEAKA